MQHLAWTGLFLPLLGFLIILASSHCISRRVCNFIACATIGLAFLCFAAIVAYGDHTYNFTLFSWIPVKGISADFAIHLDHLCC